MRYPSRAKKEVYIITFSLVLTSFGNSPKEFIQDDACVSLVVKGVSGPMLYAAKTATKGCGE